MILKDSQNQYNNLQSPLYKDKERLTQVKRKLSLLSPLVSSRAIDHLTNKLSNADLHNNFIIQIGECAEQFNSIINKQYIYSHCNLIEEVSNIVSNNLKCEVIKIGRIAGQFAKPRSNIFEEQRGCKLNSFRGEIINGFNFSSKDREYNPYRMLMAYYSSNKALQHINSFYQQIENSLFTSHEALLLDYEESLTKKIDNKYYNLGAHLLWLGARTSQINGDHIKYLKNIANPIGIKIHPQMLDEQLVEIIKILNPNNKKGKIVLIVRLGKDNINLLLETFINIVHKNNLQVNWLVDPMHGNTKVVNNVKTRYFNDILEDINAFFTIMKKHNIKGSGIHLEVANEFVTECIGGITNPINIENLSDKYLAICDPRLNCQQTLELTNLTTNFITQI
ncbi:3-deoxy-7-phosphoheptulonate synthase [Rickettsiales bacterium LUAb2]